MVLQARSKKIMGQLQAALSEISERELKYGYKHGEGRIQFHQK